MLQAQLKNGLPLKPIEYIGIKQDFEKIAVNPPEKNKKIFLIDEKFVKKTSGILENVHFIDEIIYFDYGNKYLVCLELTLETKKHLSGNNEFILAYADYKKNTIKYINLIKMH